MERWCFDEEIRPIQGVSFFDLTGFFDYSRSPALTGPLIYTENGFLFVNFKVLSMLEKKFESDRITVWEAVRQLCWGPPKCCRVN